MPGFVDAHTHVTSYVEHPGDSEALRHDWAVRNAKLTVDGIECPLPSDIRAFETPKLQPGQQFYYTVKAEVVRDGKPVARSGCAGGRGAAASG